MDKQLIENNNLWHYTTIDGLMGILESQRLWATDYRHLNDTSELKYAKNILGDELFKKVVPMVQEEYDKKIRTRKYIDQDGGVERVARKETKDVVDILWEALMQMYHIPCISSFCLGVINDKDIQSDGLLSQWRGYGADGGYAIVFNSSEMLKSFEQECRDFIYAISGSGDVCYKCDVLNQQHDLFKHLNRIITFAYNLFRFRIYNTDEPNPNGNDLESLVHCLARFKHQGFKEEREYRFFVFAHYDEEAVKKEDIKQNTPLKERNKPFKKIQNRLCKGTSVPYVELFETIPRLPIERIVVGPHKDKEKRIESLTIYLKSKGLHDIKVDCSGIPYIGLSH